MRALVGCFLIGGLVCLLAACNAAPALTESPTERDNKILSDTFENKNNQWDEYYKDKLGKAGYVEEDQSYHIEITQSNTFLWANPLTAKTAALSDSTVSVQAKRAKDGTNNLFGVICRYQNERNFYFFVISSDGHFGIGKMVDGKYQLINRADYPPSSAILKEHQTNRIRAECVGKQLSLYVNDQLVDQQTDEDFASGNVGLIAGSLSGATTIEFDEFEVRRP